MEEIEIIVDDLTEEVTLGVPPSSDGDMTKAVYDLTNKSADAFDYDNFDNTPTTITAQQGTDISDNNSKVSFPEAPVDGKEYNRKDASWVEDTGGNLVVVETDFVNFIRPDTDRSFYITQTGVINIGIISGSYIGYSFINGIIVGNSTNSITDNIGFTIGDPFDNTKENVFFILFFDGDVKMASNYTNDLPDVIAPLIVSATIEIVTSDELDIIFDEPVNITNVVGLSLDTGLSALTITSIISGGGTNTLKLQLSGNAVDGDAGNLVVLGTNTIEDLSGNPLAAVTQNVINKTSGLFIDFNGTDIATYFDLTNPDALISESGGLLLNAEMESFGATIVPIRDNNIDLKVAHRITLADTETVEIEITGFTWNEPTGGAGGNGNDTYFIGLKGDNDKCILWISSASAATHTKLASLLLGSADTTDFVSNDNIEKGTGLKIRYTYNSGLPSSSLIEWLEDSGGSYSVIASTSADVGNVISVYNPIRHLANKQSQGASIDSLIFKKL